MKTLPRALAPLFVALASLAAGSSDALADTRGLAAAAEKHYETNWSLRYGIATFATAFSALKLAQ